MPRIADFSQTTKDLLAKKVGFRCSDPFCRKLTIGASADGSKAINVGEAAHITAAEPGGPRYDSIITEEQRKAEANGIWLCRTHAAMVDRDETYFTVELLLRWKALAEKESNEAIQGIVSVERNQFNLRVLYDDLKACSEKIEEIISINRNVVFNAEDLHIPLDYEKKIESVFDYIGMTYASRMRKCFLEIEAFKEVLKEENKRFKGRSGKMADLQAVIYGHKLEGFLSLMKKLNIQELVEMIGKLFDESD